MSTIIEIDKAGRIVVPKRMRDALHLAPGTRLKIERLGDTLTLEQDLPEPRMEMIDGLWAITGGPWRAVEDVNAIVEEQRERRMRYVAGLSDEP